MLISDLLRRKGDFVATVPPDTDVAVLLRELAEHNVGALVVSTDGATVAGIVSERDVVRAMHSVGAAILASPVSDIMTVDVTVAGPSDPVDTLMPMMTERRIRHVPVVSDGRLVGIISIGDVVKSRIDELETEREHLIDYISSSR
jgi:CBS domain-containing protein